MSWLRFRPGLAPGAPAPAFDRLDEDGTRHTLEGHRGRWLLLFFYPKDNTPGCIRQACGFNDDFDAFQALGCDVLGCSGQDAESHRRFRQACRLRYRLLSDPDHAMREAWKVPHVFNWVDGRCSFLVDPQGLLRWIYLDAKRPEAHAPAALEALRRLTAQGDH